MAGDIPQSLGEELKRLLQQRPFRPFRIHLKDGKVYEIRFPDVNLPGDTCVQVGIPEPNKVDPFAEYWDSVFYSEIDRLEVEGTPQPTPEGGMGRGWNHQPKDYPKREDQPMATHVPKVQSEDFLRLLRQRPFRPFRIHLKDGRVYEVRFPDINLVGETYIVVGFPEPDKADPFAESFEYVFFTAVDHLEVEAAASSAAG